MTGDDAVAGLTEGVAATDRTPETRRPGQLSDIQRRRYNAILATLTASGRPGSPEEWLVAATGQPMTPVRPGLMEVAQLEQFTDTAIAQDLRYGGWFVGRLATTVLRWAVPMLAADDMEPAVSQRLHAVVGMLAHRGAWAAFDCGEHESTRSLFRLALQCAARADDPDLRAHVLADVAAQYSFLGYPLDALGVVGLVEYDPRVASPVRMVLQAVKARAFAALGDAKGCRRCVDAVEHHYIEARWPTAREDGHWVQSLHHPWRVAALTGHALADLASRSGGRGDVERAIRRLTDAVDNVEPVGRAHALCATRLARLLLEVGDLERGGYYGHLALRSATELRSTRLTRELAALRTQAASLGEEPATRTLVEAIDDIERVACRDNRPGGAR